MTEMAEVRLFIVIAGSISAVGLLGVAVVQFLCMREQWRSWKHWDSFKNVTFPPP
jgi:hypothetical protein